MDPFIEQEKVSMTNAFDKPLRSSSYCSSGSIENTDNDITIVDTDTEVIKRSIQVLPYGNETGMFYKNPEAQAFYHDNSQAQVEDFFGFPVLKQTESKKTIQKLPDISPFSQCPALLETPVFFSRETSFYLKEYVGASDFFQDISALLTKYVDVDFTYSNTENEISGLAFGGMQSGECNFTISCFRAPRSSAFNLLVEIRHLGGCAQIFRQFYNRTVMELKEGCILEFVCPNPTCVFSESTELLINGGVETAFSLDDLDGLDLPSFGDGSGSDDGASMAMHDDSSAVDFAFSLISSQFAEDQEEGIATLLQLCKTQADCLSQGTQERIVDLFISNGLLQSMDSTITRRACEVVETLCVSSVEVREKVVRLLLEQMMNVLDAPDSVFTNKSKRHVVKALEHITKSHSVICPSHIRVLRQYSSCASAHISQSIAITLHQIGAN